MDEIKIQELDIKPNSVIAIYLTDKYSFDKAQQLAKELKEVLPRNTTILLMREGTRIEDLSEEMMNRVGWYRMDIGES